MSYWRQASSERLSGMLFTVALFSHTRYESPLMLAPIAVIIAILGVRDKRLPSLHWTLVLLPVLFLSIAWQYRFVSVNDKFKQFSAEGEGFFNLQYMFENLGHAVNFLLMPSEKTAASPILGIVGLLSALVVTILFITRCKKLTESSPDRSAAYIIGLAILLQFLVILSFTYGQLDDPIVSRLGLPLMLYLIVCSAIAVAYLEKKSGHLRYLPHAIIALAMAYSLYQYPKIRTREATVINNYAEWVLDHHRSLPKGNYLYITHINRYLELYDIGNIQHNRALTNPEAIKLHLSTSTFDKVFVAQAGTVDLNEAGELAPRLLPGNNIGSAFELREIRETRTIPLGFIRLSEIVAVDFDPEVHQEEIDALYSASPFGAEIVEMISHERINNWIRSLP